METEDTKQEPTLTDKAAQLPTSPGVYLMKDRQGSVIYVGKAKVLRNRVRSYFQRQHDESPKTRLMVSKIVDIDTIVTPTEKDALILENSLIKKYRPRFNVLFRDDKEYPYLKLSAAEPFPNLTIVRKPKKDGSVYFGPFASSQAVRETVKTIHKIFPIRKCSGKKMQRGRPCLYHELGQCPAPCSKGVDPDRYRQTVREVQLFLQGRSSQVVSGLKRQMEQEAQNLQFEAAARIRDRVTAIEKTLEKQSVVSLDFEDRDVFACYRDGADAGVTILFVRGGRITGSRNAMLRRVRLADEEVLHSFVSQYYDSGEHIPEEILVPFSFEDSGVLEEWLREKKGSGVKLALPRRGAKKELLDMAARNAELMFVKARQQGPDPTEVLEDLRQRLHLQNYPHRIACFDISNIMGTSAVGAMVVFEAGHPCKQAYRKFRIKTVEGANDYAMMEEVLARRLAHAGGDEPRPDLIVVDGGKGQLGVLCRLLKDCGSEAVDAAALAKGPERERAKKKQEEKVFIPHRKNQVSFPHNSPSLFLLQRIRDEAHRCAVTYYQQLKKKKDFTSELEDIPGVGAKTVKALLKHFGSLAGVKKATIDELVRVPAMTRDRAENVYFAFRSGEEGGAAASEEGPAQ
ncbi:excinuclease ABC subunit UvrC [Thermodesulfobacteriota bacterium]